MSITVWGSCPICLFIQTMYHPLFLSRKFFHIVNVFKSFFKCLNSTPHNQLCETLWMSASVPIGPCGCQHASFVLKLLHEVMILCYVCSFPYSSPLVVCLFTYFLWHSKLGLIMVTSQISLRSVCISSPHSVFSSSLRCRCVAHPSNFLSVIHLSS